MTDMALVLERIRALCMDRQVDAVDGTQTDAEAIWPSEILAIMDDNAPEA